MTTGTRLLSLCLLLAACGSARPSAIKPAARPVADIEPVPSGRLPGHTRPIAYALELSVSPKKERFSGRTQITTLLSEPRRLIWLHGKDLDVTSVRARLGESWIPGSYKQMNGDGVAMLRFEQVLPPGQVTLEIVYDAAFDKQLKGLYRVDSGGDAYAFTQFESISARAAFPSFDEPGFKTSFELWLTVPASDVAASNTPIIGEEQAGELKRVHFAPSKPLPTYLVALAVGPLDVVEAAPIPASSVRDSPLPLRGLCPRGQSKQLGYALNEATRALRALEGYFGIAYPYEKLDIVAVPDFAAGAMENAALVTFRDSLLLIDPAQSSEVQRRNSSFVMVHELAHMWFGDLVTMDYWDDIWLNEAFATWMEYRTSNELHPEFEADLELADDVQNAMEADSRTSARMIRQPIKNSHDIMNAFDAITYSKGGGVITMFERYLGADLFRKGIQRYLGAHAFGNARTQDLLASLDSSSEKDVAAPFESFLSQVGVPLVAAQISCSEGSSPLLLLQQSRYLPLASRGSTKQRWQIPVCTRYEVSGKTYETCSLLTDERGTVLLEGTRCPSWFMPNADGAGYYRFTVPSPELEKLRSQGLRKLTTRERYTLARSLHAGFLAGSVSAKDRLDSLPAFAADPQRSVAIEPMAFVEALNDHWLDDLSRPRLQAYALKLYASQRNRLGLRELQGESGDSKLLRAEVLRFSADVANDLPTRDRLARLARQYLGIDTDAKLHLEVLPIDLVGLAIRIMIEDGDERLYDAVYQRLKNTEDGVQRGHYLHALGSVHDKRSERALGLVLDPMLRVNEVFMPLRDQLSDRRTRAGAYQWFEQNFDAIAKRVAPNAMASTPWLATGFCNTSTIERLRTFFTPRIGTLPGGPRSLEGASEALRLCEALVNAQGPGVQAYFKKH